MHRTWTLLASLAISAVAATACSSSSGGGGGSTGDNDSGGSSSGSSGGTGTPVSFATDVMPIFAMSCATFSVCHASEASSGATPKENLSLGMMTGDTAADIATTYANIVGVKSEEDPQMNLVTAGDTANSYMLLKLSDMQGNVASACAAATPLCADDCTTAEPCGSFMPYLGTALSESEPPTQFQTISDWIAQGAKNN